MKLIFLFFLIPLFSSVDNTDFDTLMGKNTRVFRFVKLEEDKKNYALFRTLFQERHNKFNTQEQLITKTIHFIWLGPKPYPLKSIPKLHSWMQLHKDFTFKLWTDRKRNLNIQGLQEIIVQESDLTHLLKPYQKSNNPAEKSDLLRYEILYNEGGLYLDHDITCLKRLEPNFFNHEFFATLSPLAKPIVYPNTIRIRNSLIAFKPKHPLFLSLFQAINQKFEEIKDNGIDYHETLKIVTKRTFIPFHQALLNDITKANSSGIIYPIGYFTRILKADPIYADESMDGLWWREEKSFYEEYLETRVNKLENRLKYLTLSTLILFALTMITKRKKYVRAAE